MAPLLCNLPLTNLKTCVIIILKGLVNMFYVSRAVYHGAKRGCYVIDTDDGVEEFVSAGDLWKYFELGIEIKGVTRTPMGRGYWNYEFTPCIVGRSGSEAKSSMLRGINFALAQNGDLLELSLNESFFKDKDGDIVLNLGDYSSVIGDCSLLDLSVRDKTTILIFDERITEIYSKAFDNLKYGLRGVRFNIRGCQNDKAIERIYSFVAKNAFNYGYSFDKDWTTFISDTDTNRYDRLTIEHTIFTGKIPIKRLDTYIDEVIVKNKSKTLGRFLEDSKKYINPVPIKHCITLDATQVFLEEVLKKNRADKMYDLMNTEPRKVTYMARALGVTISRFSQVWAYLASGGRDPYVNTCFNDFVNEAIKAVRDAKKRDVPPIFMSRSKIRSR